ncbi:phytoene desaturase family protein [Microbacterium terricola]|uniref:Pyridine nucleotide-disulfide oxidoreductase domain-containing protein 2 n=1 Tax=Microbacterium terricola TaxID=344163 RepID=A0ABM8E1N3_9MICO|nr:NAD(P)/FAD-dependent oxidoreductase [Microbacterium terricola]UYK40567.1 NAD(P)/FAD-dependent oxidoreductase [Microbacterium terricola]BDV31705.1 P49 secreted protein [Microbacterium terricola]
MARRATIVGSGPNGLAAAVALARAGYAVRVLEAAETIGGGTRTAELTLPGFRHDVGSAVHPAALSSPFFRAAGVHERVDWIIPDASFAHPLDGGRAAIAWRDLGRTVEELGADGRAWRAVLGPLNDGLRDVQETVGGPLLRLPPHPFMAARFGARMLQLGTRLGDRVFRTEAGAALLAGVLAHANTRLPSPAAAAAALLLAAHTHSTGWGFPRGGAQAIADALSSDLRAHGGEIETGVQVRTLAGLDVGDRDAGDLLLLDTSPRLAATHPDVPPRYARALRRYRYGPGAAKLDLALDGPVPWTNPDLSLAPTVHLGGSRAEIVAAENAVAAGRIPARPYVLAVQPSVLDETRAPSGKAVLWAYMHVPRDSPFDPTEAIIAQVERFAPGVRDRILAAHVTTAADREALNPAEVGGDILGGAFSLVQAVRRPVASPAPWRTPMRGVYLASAATPPGPGVSGMPGWWAARQALRDSTGVRIELDDLF